MPIHPGCILKPTNPVPRTFVPQESTPYPVKDNDSWDNLAPLVGMDVWQLIRFNYPTLPADQHLAAREVNWYLQEYVGCRLVTPDGKNYRFSTAADPGIIYLPAPRKAKAPVLESIKERRASIMMNTPGLFRVAPNEDAHPYACPWYAKPELEETTLNWLTIQKMAQRYKLNPDFVSAIVWMESTHGWYDRFDPTNKTIRPMNVHARLWAQLGISRSDLENPEINIAAGVHILAAIWDRTEDPTYEKVATLYNKLGDTKVSEYGKTIVVYMNTRPWASKIAESWRQYHDRHVPPLKVWKNR